MLHDYQLLPLVHLDDEQDQGVVQQVLKIIKSFSLFTVSNVQYVIYQGRLPRLFLSFSVLDLCEEFLTS